ncbi:ribonuclease H-like YkuK family protein [Neomoorella carbonis]|uniref:ribonuclease H-like YkuK family protein n=1 Tax=Neomoorella carbonis TaxID=3062783 RepID=UPI0032564FF3
MYYISPTRGRLTAEEMFADMMQFIEANPEAQYKIIIGTDSQARVRTCFVTAVIVHQVGRGARYYYRKRYQRKITSLRQKIFYETALSLEAATFIAQKLSASGHADLNLEIHLDIGPNGDTRDLIREIVGMVVGSGFAARIKPYSCGASKVADKYTKSG